MNLTLGVIIAPIPSLRLPSAAGEIEKKRGSHVIPYFLRDREGAAAPLTWCFKATDDEPITESRRLVESACLSGREAVRGTLSSQEAARTASPAWLFRRAHHHNRPAFLKEAIRSGLTSTTGPFELLIWDNGSDADTRDVIAR